MGERGPDAYLGHRAFVLFGDRCPDDALREKPREAIDLDDVAGADWLNHRLARYRVRVSRPRPHTGAA